MWLKYLILYPVLFAVVNAMSQSFVNSSSGLRPVFVVNFDISSVICQTSANQDDLKIFPISVLCDGKKDCFENPAMDDETFPYCSHKCINDCGDHGVCLMDGGRSLCYCDDGYSGKKCEVKGTNECSKKPCHWLARCTNTFGSYYCTCLPGFEGDGHNCTDIDECADPKIALHCPSNAKCCNIPGSFFCNCTEGFIPKGTPLTACIDIDECSDNTAKCKENEVCVNSVGSYKCVQKSNHCEKGFEEKEGKCVDINECVLPNDCDQRSECINTNGSYQCICIKGFAGNGKSCIPVTDCSQQPAVCHKNAFCIKELKMCVCQNGFIGDGITCYDMNECLTEPPVCKSNEKCLNLEGSFACCPFDQNFDECKKAKGLSCKLACGLNAECRRGDCVCKDGFAGDPTSGCSDRNECALNPTICPANHWCVNLDGSYMCCSDDAPVTLCKGLLIGVSSELNEAGPNVTTVNASTITGSSSFQSTKSLQGISLSATPTTTDKVATSSSSPDKLSSGSSTSAFGGLSSTVAVTTLPLSHSTSKDRTTEGVSTPSTKLISLPNVGFTVDKAAQTTIVPCSEDRLKFCATRNMSCVIVNEESRCHGCAKGFVENEKGICVDEDSGSTEKVNCTLAIDCDKYAKCIDVEPEGHLCVCKSGFIGDGKRCDDVDECYSPNICSPNAQCINSIGSYNCTCNAGFIGDGTTCTERRAGETSGCAVHPDRCHEFAKCINDNCQCIPGYLGNGTFCTKVNVTSADCVADPTACDPNAECVERHCQCRIGYLGDGLKCRPDPDDCHLNISLCGEDARCVARRCRCLDNAASCRFADCSTFPSLCHIDAECVDKLCRCRDGFEGNGTFCRSLATTSSTSASAGSSSSSGSGSTGSVHITTAPGVDNCDKFPSVCHRNAKCISDQCICDDGYVGNGRSCIPDPNDCKAYPKICHPNATCVSKMHCLCKPSFTGDGITNCQPLKPEENCALTPTLCHKHAACINFACKCNNGYAGDGVLACTLNTTDCSIDKSICHDKAACLASKCVCDKGFVGDGVVCKSIEQQFSCEFNSTVCNMNADCISQRCICRPGFAGNGLTCQKEELIASGRNCHSDPGLCDLQAVCVNGQCVCKPDFAGNGTVCVDLRQTKLTTAASLLALSSTAISITGITDPFANLCSENTIKACHKMAECVKEGSKEECRCHAGFSGDGKLICEDINECSLRLVQCHKTATCVNTLGSYMCLCPSGQKGDGINNCYDVTKEQPEAIDVECERDGLTLVLNNKRDFNGKMFVKNQSQNPKCSQNYTTSDGPVYKFTAHFSFCDVRMEAHHTFSTVVVVQKHPLFVTDGDEAFNLRCTYPAGEVMLMSHFNVSMLSTVDTLSKDGPPPQCSLTVLSTTDNRSIAEATVGQLLQLRLIVEPQATYGILAKNCVAVNMENGETYRLTDSNGCSVDASIFPEWNQFRKSQLYVNFLTFKWPDAAQIRFQCDCSPCFDECEPAKCGETKGVLAWGRKKKSVAFPPIDSRVYSNVVQVKESEKLLAQDMDDDMYNMESSFEGYSRGHYFTNEEHEVCMNSGLLAAALGLAISMAAVITVTAICSWQQRAVIKSNRKYNVELRYENPTIFGFKNVSLSSDNTNSIGQTTKFSKNNFRDMGTS